MSRKTHQTVIPKTSTLSFTGMNKRELREWCKTYYKSHYKLVNVSSTDFTLQIKLRCKYM